MIRWNYYISYSFFLCLLKSSVSGEIGDVISGKLSVPEEKTKIFKSLGK